MTLSEELPLRPATSLTWKDRIRHSLLPVVTRCAETVSMDGMLGVLSDPDARLISQATEVRRVIQKAMEKWGTCEQPLDIVFLSMIGGHRFLFAAETVLGLMLRARGHNVSMVVCDQDLPACEVKKSSNRADWDRSCGRCWSFGRHLSTSFGLNVIGTSELRNQIDEAESADDVDLDSIIEASLLKHFMVGSLDHISELDERKKAYRDASLRSYQVGRAIAARKPDRVLMSHGIYSTWGPAREHLNATGVPVISYGKGKKRQTIKFNWSVDAAWWDVSEEWEAVKDQPLSEIEDAEISDYLDSRREHSRDTMVYNFGKVESAESTKTRLGLDSQKLTYTAFTNVLWDATSAQREIAFDNPIDWILKTIQWFDQHSDRQLIVKIHPAEVVIGTKQPFAKIIRDAFPKLPENVRVIDPSEEINSWSIIKVTDLGLVHTSTVGIELPLEGVPVAVVSRTHFRERGFTLDVESRQEYFDLLTNFHPDQIDRESLKTISKRYTSLLFSRYQMPFDFFDEPAHSQVQRFRLDRLSELADSDVAKCLIPTLERGEGSFLIPRR